MLELKHARRQREQGFHNHALTPSFVRTKLEVACRFARFLKAKITQDNRLLVELMRHWTKGLVMDMCRIPIPSHDFASVIDQPTQLDTHDPTAVAFAFLAHLLLTAPFPNGMDQFNPIGVNHGKEGGIRQQAFTPISVDAQRPLNPGAIRQLDKQILKVALQPAVESPEEAPFERI